MLSLDESTTALSPGELEQRRPMKLSEFIWKPWSLPLMVGVEAVAIIGGMCALFHFVPGPIVSRPERKTEIRNYSVESQACPIQITDLKSGTEFNRIPVPIGVF